MTFAELFSLALIAFAYGCLAIFGIGVAYRLFLYARTPAPLKIALTPAPATAGGVAARLAGDVLIFKSLWQADKLLWAASWLFHASLALILTRHLRYLLYPVPGLILDLQTASIWAGFLLPAMGLYLFFRRMAYVQNLFISGIPDYAALILLGSIAATGLLAHFVARVYLVDVKAFMLGLVTFYPVAPPLHPLFLAHFVLVCVLAAYFPYSKLMHAGGIFFSPTRNQRWNVRRQRHVNPWDAPAGRGAP